MRCCYTASPQSYDVTYIFVFSTRAPSAIDTLSLHDALPIWPGHRALFREQTAHQLGRRDVEGRVGDGYAFGRPAHARVTGDFGGAALLDGDRASVGHRDIDAGKRRRNVKRNAVALGEHGKRVGA